jgi:uncharacterized protein YbjT (DUF2867 family)
MRINAIIFGATGHIGQGVLIECLENPVVTKVLSIGRSPTGREHPKLVELHHTNFLDYTAIKDQMAGYNACFFCLGVSSVGMREETYRLITHDYAVAAARTLSAKNPEMTFCFVSGAGTDETMQSRMMWARVKGQTENDLLALPFKQVFVLRPAFIQPMKGVQTGYAMYKIMRPLFPLLKRIAPKWVTTTEEVGRTMIRLAQYGSEKKVLENTDIIDISQKI